MWAVIVVQYLVSKHQRRRLGCIASPARVGSLLQMNEIEYCSLCPIKYY
jgi:hypothetical protein